MGGGLLSGLFWGTLASAIVLGAVSMMAPLPERSGSGPVRAVTAPQLAAPTDDPAPDVSGAGNPVEPRPTDAPATGQQQQGDAVALGDVSVPAGSEFRRERPDTAPSLPRTDASPSVADVSVPVAADTVSPPQADTPLTTRVEATLDVAAPAVPVIDSAAPDAPVTDSSAVLPTPQPALPPSVVADAMPVADLMTPDAPSGVVIETTAVAPVSSDTATTGGVSGAALAPADGAQPASGAMALTAEQATGETVSEVSRAADAAPAVMGELTDLAPVADRLEGAEVQAGGIAAIGGANIPTAPAGTESMAAASQTGEAVIAAPADFVPATAQGDAVGATQTADAQIAARDATPTAPSAGGGTEVAALQPESRTPSVVALPRSTPRQPEGQGAAVTMPMRVQGTEVPPLVDDKTPEPAGGVGVRVTPITERRGVGSLIPATPEQPENATEVLATAPKLSALSRNAAVFSDQQDKPLFSVILIDAGADGLDRQTLTTFSFPVTFAVDPTAPDAEQAVSTYRRAGFEVLLLAEGLPPRATPQDVDVTLNTYLETFPEVIGVMDLSSGVIARNRTVSAQVIDILGEDGHGLVLYDSGLNATQKAAESANLGNGLIFRTLDAEKERSTRVQRYLDRAAFKAAQDGSVIMVGHSYGETVTALFQWALTGRAGSVTLAPASAVLQNR